MLRYRDPAVAKRVRILHVYPGFIKETLDGRTDPTLRRSFASRVLDFGNVFDISKQLFFFSSRWHPKHRIIPMLQRTEDLVQIMLEVLSGLPNVTDYYVTWSGLPPVTASAVSFLSTVFQSNLRKLSLSISLENVKNLLTPSFQVQHLEELDLCIYPERVPLKERAAILDDHLAPAINALHKTLRTLTIRSWEPTDLAPLFYAIRRLPALEELHVSIPIEPVHLGDAEGFSRLLVTHSATLRTLHLRASCSGSTSGNFTPDIISFDTWVREAICSVHLPNLTALDISSQHFPLATAEACVRQFGGSIRSLALTGCRRGYANVEDLLDIILVCQAGMRDPDCNPGLQRLRLNVEILSPQLVTLFETKLPRLQRLELINKYLLPNSSSHFPTFSNVEQTTIQIVRCLFILFRLLIYFSFTGQLRHGHANAFFPLVEATIHVRHR